MGPAAYNASMEWTRAICLGLIAASRAAAGSVDFAIGANLDPHFDRFGVDAQGDILIASAPSGCKLPVFNAISTCGPLWVGKLDPTGQNLLFGTYLGRAPETTFSTWVAGVAADAAGNMVMAAYTTDRGLPTLNAFQAAPPAPASYFNVYVVKFTPDGSHMIYATYLGGTGAQEALSLAVDAGGSAYVAIWTVSADFPTTPQSAHDPPGNSETAIAKLSADGKLLYGVTFAFAFYTEVKPIALDATGGALLASTTQVLRVAPDGSSLARTNLPVWATSAGPWALPRAAGGYSLAGTGNGLETVTPGALQTYLDGNGYVRIELNTARQPQLPAPVLQLAVDPANRNRLYAATGMGLYRTDDNGWDWTQVRAGAATAVAVDPFDSTRLYLAGSGSGAMFRSTDSGATWAVIGGSGLKNAAVTSVDADPNIAGLIYAAAGSVFRSKDGGDTWDAHTAGPTFPSTDGSGQLFSSTGGVKVDGSHAGWAYAVGTTRCTGFCPVTENLWRTRDGGDTWTDTGASGKVTGSGVVAIDANTGDVAQATGSGLLIFHGGDFSSAQPVLGIPVTAAVFDPQHPGSLYVAAQVTAAPGSGYFVMSSADDGNTWSTVVQLDRSAYNLATGAGAVLHATQSTSSAEGFVEMTDGSGNAVYATYFGSAATQVNVAASGNGLVYVGGSTQGGIPAVDAFQAAVGGGTDGFLAAFTESGTLVWSSYLGGGGNDSINWLYPMADGSVLVVGTSASADFPNLQASPLGAGSAFIARVRP